MMEMSSKEEILNKHIKNNDLLLACDLLREGEWINIARIGWYFIMDH